MIKMLLACILVIVPVTVSSSCVDIDKKCSENDAVFQSVPLQHDQGPPFADSVTDVRNFLQNGLSSEETFAPEPIKESVLLDLSKEVSCKPETIRSNGDVSETRDITFLNSILDAPTTIFAQKVDDKFTSNQELQTEGNNGAICVDESSHILQNTFTNDNKMEDVRLKNEEDNRDINTDPSVSPVNSNNIIEVIKTHPKRAINEQTSNKYADIFTNVQDFDISDLNNNQFSEDKHKIKQINTMGIAREIKLNLDPKIAEQDTILAYINSSDESNNGFNIHHENTSEISTVTSEKWKGDDVSILNSGNRNKDISIPDTGNLELNISVNDSEYPSENQNEDDFPLTYSKNQKHSNSLLDSENRKEVPVLESENKKDISLVESENPKELSLMESEDPKDVSMLKSENRKSISLLESRNPKGDSILESENRKGVSLLFSENRKDDISNIIGHVSHSSGDLSYGINDRKQDKRRLKTEHNPTRKKRKEENSDGELSTIVNFINSQSGLLEKLTSAKFKDDQQRPNRRTDDHIEESKLEFPEVPEGESFHIQELGLSEGMFVFSYLSNFLSWIQPYDFPVELLRDALWSRVSVVDLITQSLQVEVGFIVCLTVGVLLALGVPCILIVHACCRLLDSKRNSNWSEDSSSETTNNCIVNFRRCTLLFVVQLILLLLVAGIVAMFVTNEQMSRAVDQTPSVVHTALRDVTTFLRNSHQQLQFVITKSLDQAVDAAYTDLDNVEELLGRPIQDELAEETGVDVALDALVDVSTAARTMSGKVEDFLTSCMETRGMIMESREQLADLRMQVDMFRQQCPARFRPLCNTVNASGLDIVLRLDTMMSDERFVQIRDLRDGNLTLVTQQARGEFQYIPLRVEKDTRDARNGVKRQLSRQKEMLDSSIWSLDVVTRDLTYKIENARSQAMQIAQGVSAIEQWRWLTGLGAALSVLLLWFLILVGITCGCCGVEERAGPTLLASVILVCLFSVLLWTVALCALLVGGHGEVFMCRPLYDEPEYRALTRLVDRPGVLFQRGGGFFSNLLYGNSTMDVPLKDVLQQCQGNGTTYTAFKLRQVFDVDSASNHKQWDSLHSELSRLHVNLSNMVLLTPELQHQLQDLLQATTVNVTSFRVQMSGQVTGKDLTSFADQMSSVANQITDWPTLNRLENVVSTTRNIMAEHIQPLEQKKEDLVYQLTALEMQLAPLQRQVNQSLSHLKTIQYYINNQGENIAYQKSQAYISRLTGYMDQYRAHVLNTTQHHVAPCRPIWNLYHAMRLFLCRHIIDPLNGFWFATVWCLLLFLAATPLCLKLIDHYRHLKQSGLLRSRSSESPSETLMIPEQGAPWSTPGVPEHDGW